MFMIRHKPSGQLLSPRLGRRPKVYMRKNHATGAITMMAKADAEVLMKERGLCETRTLTDYYGREHSFQSCDIRTHPEIVEECREQYELVDVEVA